MPTMIRENGYRVVIYSNDHIPAHVHVLKNNAEIRMDLGNDETKPALMSVRGPISNQEIAKALELVKNNQAQCLAKWRKIHE